jgi:predicted nucleic acid-binding protein
LEVADRAFERLATAAALVPAVWWFEIRNALLMSERRARIDAMQVAEILAHLKKLPIQEDRTPDNESVLLLARSHRLSVYDASYLELARRRDLPLATLDQALAAAARAASVELVVGR